MILKLAMLFGGGGNTPSAVSGVPGGQRVYAVGDIHGHDDLLARLLKDILADAKGFKDPVTLVFIGDYIDRGPQSRQVVERLMGLKLPGNVSPVFLRGNHEQAMLEFIGDPDGRPDWLGWGGIEALASYGVALYTPEGRQRALPSIAAELEGILAESGQLAFLKATKLMHQVGAYLFVHAGVRPGVPLHRQLDTDLLFIREGFVDVPHGLPHRVVYGHTIVGEPVIAADRIGIDTGAYGGGPLTAVALEGNTVRVLQARPV